MSTSTAMYAHDSQKVRELTPEEKLMSFWTQRFNEAVVAKSPFTKRWLRYIDAYNGEYFKGDEDKDYKSNLVSNYIFSIIETIRPIMVDNDPKFQSIPRQPEGMEFSNNINEALTYEWDRTRMSPKLWSSLVPTLQLGTSIFFVPWDKKNKQIDAIPISIFNALPDPLSTNLHNAGYFIYADYIKAGQLRRRFPEHADKLVGGQIKFPEFAPTKDASNPGKDDVILVLEVWAKEWAFDDIDGKKNNFKNGRVLTYAPDCGVILSDKENPYDDGEFPFVIVKDYDLPNQFWGEGEIAQLLSPQTHMNELYNSIIDHAKHTANVPWILDKNSGIPVGSITNRPGLVIRKNPGTAVERPAPPPIPAYISNTIDALKNDMEQVSGVFDTLKGNSETGVYTAQGILALQEAGQARIRLKVKLLEDSLSDLGNMFLSRMRQFWNENKFIKLTRSDGTADFRMLKKDMLQFDYDVRITAGSTIATNRGAMLDLMIRLAQTQMPDGQPLVDREAVVQFLPEEVKSSIMRRMGDKHVVLEEVQQDVQELTQSYQQSTQQLSASLQEMMGAVEKLNAQILQLQDSHAKMEESEKRNSELQSARDDGYNQGFTEAESQSQPFMADGDPNSLLDDEFDSLPEYDEEFLAGLNDLTDDELALLVEQNPELADLITGARL